MSITEDDKPNVEPPDPPSVDLLLDRLVSSQQDLSSELAGRARAIEEGRRKGRTWDETKREILGRPP